LSSKLGGHTPTGIEDRSVAAIPTYVADLSELRTDRIEGCAQGSPCYLRVHAASDFLTLQAELDWYADVEPPESQEVDWLSADPFAASAARHPGRFERELVISRDCPELVAALLTAFIQIGAACRIDPFEPLRGWDWPRHCSEDSEIESTVAAIERYSFAVRPGALEQVYIWAIPEIAELEASQVIGQYREDPWNAYLWNRIHELGVIAARMQDSVCSIAMPCPEFEAIKRVVCESLRRVGIEIRVENEG
jgi:hypothetical protein